MGWFSKSKEETVEKQTDARRTHNSEASTAELGVAGIRQSSGFIHDEFLNRLRGERGRRIYREMRDNDAIISAIFFAIENLFRGMDWMIEPGADGDAGKNAADFVEGVLFDDMEHTWDDHMAEILTMLQFGWSLFEVVYKRRIGPDESDPSRRSLFSDGQIGIRKLAARSQETLYQWDMDQKGNIFSMIQRPPNGGANITIPMSKTILYKAMPFKSSPEGRSLLRGAYRSWYFKKNIEEIEAVAIERELAGLPVVSIPAELLGSSKAEDRAVVQQYVRMARDVKMNEQGGIVIPSDPFVNKDGTYTQVKKVDFRLVNAGGSRTIDTDRVINRYAHDIARSVLIDFIMLGGTDRGSFALSKSKTDVFLKTIQGYQEQIAAVINRVLIPSLWSANGFDYDVMPYLKPGRAAPNDLEEISDYLFKLAQAGMPLFPDNEMEDHLRNIAGLPDKVENGQVPIVAGDDNSAGRTMDSAGDPEAQGATEPRQRGIRNR